MLPLKPQLQLTVARMCCQCCPALSNLFFFVRYTRNSEFLIPQFKSVDDFLNKNPNTVGSAVMSLLSCLIFVIHVLSMCVCVCVCARARVCIQTELNKTSLGVKCSLLTTHL